MNEFIKQNWFKLSFAVAAILIGVSLFYYFIVYLPQNNVNKNKGDANIQGLEKQIKCQEAGSKLYKSQVEENTNTSGEVGTYGVPEFKFSTRLNTCLYKGIYIGSHYIGNFIIDVYTNKEIFMWGRVKLNNNWKEQWGSEEEWNLKVKELFGE